MKRSACECPGVTVVLGEKNRFAAEVGGWDNELCAVDLWAAGTRLTCHDSMAFVRQFRLAVLDTAAWLSSGQGSPLPFDGLTPEATHRRLMLRAGANDETEAEYEFRRRFRVLDWGPTTDNVTAHIFRDGDHLVFTLQFRRGEHLLKHPEHEGEVFVVEIPTVEFVEILEGLVAVLDSDRSLGLS